MMFELAAPVPAARNVCGVLRFDFAQCVGHTVASWVPNWVWGIIHWWPWILGAIAALVLLGILYRIKMVFGWPGVAAVLGAGIFGAGFIFGRRSATDPVEGIDDDSPDVLPPPARPRRKATGRRRYNPDTNQFEDY